MVQPILSSGTCAYCDRPFEREIETGTAPEVVAYCKKSHRKKATARRKLAAEGPPCDLHPGKERFPTPHAAWVEAEARTNYAGIALYAYRCPSCRLWHLTKKPHRRAAA